MNWPQGSITAFDRKEVATKSSGGCLRQHADMPARDDIRVITHKADHFQYAVRAGHRASDEQERTSRDGLTASGTTISMSIITAPATAPVTFLVQHLADRPERVSAGWEIAAERDIVVIVGRLCFTELMGSESEELSLPVGRYRLRAHARDRDIVHTRPNPKTAVETHLMQFWPAPTRHTVAILAGPDARGRTHSRRRPAHQC